jgi:D-amino-acid oxidase
MMTSRDCDVLVIGAGVSGLSTAIRLAEAGLSVRVVSQHPPLQTPSMAAAASWGLYLAADDDRALRWSYETLAELELLSQDPVTGVRLVNGMEAQRKASPPPDWAKSVRDFRVCGEPELPAGFASGWRYTVPAVHMPSYIAYLTQRLYRHGTTVELATVDSFSDTLSLAPVIVNCAGLGARKLAMDEDLLGVRGQLVIVENPGVDWFFQDSSEDGDLTYFLPHSDHVVLGGTAVPHFGAPGELEPSDETTKRIIERCVAIEPKLGLGRFLGHRVGIRPTRSEVRLEHTTLGDLRVIHNYGHGGSGITLSWGCAQDVISLVNGSSPVS